jgi:hypothetical protein
MPTTVFHVKPYPLGGWRIWQDGVGQPSARTNAKEPALHFARHLAQKSGNGVVVIHRADGSIEAEHVLESMSSDVLAIKSQIPRAELEQV